MNLFLARLWTGRQKISFRWFKLGDQIMHVFVEKKNEIFTILQITGENLYNAA